MVFDLAPTESKHCPGQRKQQSEGAKGYAPHPQRPLEYLKPDLTPFLL
jgi:hypothetical protein